MQRTRPFMQLFIVPALIVAVGVSACSASEESSTAGTTGGVGVSASGGSGGATESGGASNTGGSAVGKGGAVATGGATFGRGGATNLGGAGGRATGGRAATGGASSASAPTWSQLWTNYFQPRCASCHASSNTVGTSRVFNSAAQLCTFLRNEGQLNGTTTPALISASQSVLTWFSANGSMPEGNATVPANAVNDIRAWAAAGAVCP